MDKIRFWGYNSPYSSASDELLRVIVLKNNVCHLCSGLEMGRNFWFGGLCQFVLRTNRCLTHPSPTSSSGQPTQRQHPGFPPLPPLCGASWVGVCWRRQGWEAPNLCSSERQTGHLCPTQIRAYSQGSQLSKEVGKPGPEDILNNFKNHIRSLFGMWFVKVAEWTEINCSSKHIFTRQTQQGGLCPARRGSCCILFS